MKRKTFGRLLRTLRLAGGGPYSGRARGPRGRPEEGGPLTRQQLAVALQERGGPKAARRAVTEETLRRAENGQVRPESMSWLDTLADLLELLPEERAFLLSESPYFSTTAAYARCLHGERALAFLRRLLGRIALLGWVHDPFGDVLIANEMAVQRMSITLQGDAAFPFNLWRVLCSGRRHPLPWPARLALARHLRGISLPFRVAQYWQQLMAHLHAEAAETLADLWRSCATVEALMPFEWDGREGFFVFSPQLTREGPVYLTLWLPLGSIPPLRGQEQRVYSLAPWPPGPAKDPDTAGERGDNPAPSARAPR